MGDLVTIRTDFRDVERMLRAGDKEYEAAGAAALNRGGAKIRTGVVRDVAGKAKVAPRKLISKRVKIRRAKRNRLRCRVAVLTRGVPAVKVRGFRAAPHRKPGGVTTPGHHWPKGFKGKGKGGRPPVMAYRRKGRGQFPLEALRIPVKDIIEASLEAHLENGMRTVAERLPHELARRMKRA